ncbi:MAG: glycoside hydrolase family 2 protein, partial [Erysipelotrichaceae bacterium]|nr:glycoside hydrolase family 2 protein [Erysipelotrichaceae bacterium]
CMFDYATHKDFGSGDRICYHGVMDAFRNPKTASYVYAIQGENKDILEISSTMDIGDYPGGTIGDFYVFSNADSVRLYKNDVFVKEYRKSRFRALKHGPLKIDDLIGELLVENEGFDKKKAKDIHDALQILKKDGTEHLPPIQGLKIAATIKKYKISDGEANRLYGRYVGNWGGEATVWRFDAIRNKEVVLSRKLCPNADLHLEVRNSSSILKEGDTYDMAAIRIRILDGNGNIAPYAQLPVTYTAEGVIETVGPKVSTAEGGMTGTYVRTTGRKGKGKLTIHADGMEDVVIDYQVE